MRFVKILALVGVLGWVDAAGAGEQYVDQTGFAISGHDVIAYYELDQAPVGEKQPQAVPGRKDITAEYNGVTWAFTSEKNRQMFVADPEKYVPAYDGHCAYGVAQGGKVPGNPHLWRIVGGQLYLNITKNVVGFWEEDIPGNIAQSEANWPGIADNPASDSTIPFFTSDAPKAG